MRKIQTDLDVLVDLIKGGFDIWREEKKVYFEENIFPTHLKDGEFR